MCSKGHKYRKLNEAQLFCSRCGTVTNVQASGTYTPHWHPIPWLPSWTITGTTSTTGFIQTWNDVQSTLTEGKDNDENGIKVD